MTHHVQAVVKMCTREPPKLVITKKVCFNITENPFTTWYNMLNCIIHTCNSNTIIIYTDIGTAYQAHGAYVVGTFN